MEDQPLRLPPTEPVGELTFICTLGGEIDEVSLKVRFYGDDLDPDLITARLGVFPTEAWRKGQITRLKMYDRIEKTGAWLYSYPRTPNVDLGNQIKRMFSELSQDLSTWGDLTSRFDSDLTSGLVLLNWNRELNLTPDILRMISDRGLALHLDIYYEGKEEGEEENDEEDAEEGDEWKGGAET